MSFSRTISSKDELAQVARQWFKHLPDEFKPKSRLRTLFDELNFELLFTPPYTFTAQPIEHLWGYSKNYVARTHHKDRTMDELFAHTREGFYGSTMHTDHVHADCCIPSFIQHARRFFDQSLRAYGYEQFDITNFLLCKASVNPPSVVNVDDPDGVRGDIDAHEDAEDEADDE